MIKSLRLENFQSHKDSTFEFYKGLNIIVGSSNQGKTSCARALSLVLYNQWDKSWVRIGSLFTKITLTMDNGVIVIREKGDKVNKYILQIPNQPQQEYSNFGTDVPDVISKALGINKVVLDKDDALLLNYAGQLENLFLFNRSGSQKAKVFGHLSGAHYLDYALRSLATERKQTSTEKNLKDKELEDLKVQAETLKQVMCFEGNIQELENKNTALDASRQRVEVLKDLFKRVQEWKRRYTQETEKEAILGQAKAVELDSITTSVQRLKVLKQLKTWQSDLLQKETILNDARNQFDIDLKKEMETYLTTLSINKICPTCFEQLNAQKISIIRENLTGEHKCLV